MPNRYSKIIEHIFFSKYKEGIEEIIFERDELVLVANKLKIKLPKNLGDIIYSFRYRALLPETIVATASKGKEWVIRPAGRALYRFQMTNYTNIVPNPLLLETKVPDSTPGIITLYSFDDEQSLLAKVRYNRLIDIFTGITCYSLQNHLRTTVPDMGQVETDEVYIGIDRRGAHYIFPVQAKGGTDKLGVVQIEQDFALCAAKFPNLICRPIAAQFVESNLIALFSFEETENGVAIVVEKHYRLVSPTQINTKDLEVYKNLLNPG
jgi:hypothetical protein